MKIVVIVLSFLMAGLPAAAASGISVQQLTDIVGSAEARGQPDKDIAHKISGIELYERLTTDKLAVLLRHAVGEQTKEAIQALANESSFLDPPAFELLNQPPPGASEQKIIIEKARDYTVGYVGKLPNLLCTVTVRRFDNDNSGKSFHLRDVVVGDLTLNAGKESTRVRMVNGVPSTKKQLTWGMRTHDEIGGLLAGVFADYNSLQATWSHWENLDGRRVAVFRYSLDKPHSHYTVSYCCRPGVVDAPTTIATAAEGELFIDPASGVILRISEQAVGIQIGFPIRKAAIVVEYAAVPIGNKSFICPVRSVTVSDLSMPDAMALDAYSPILKRSLNEMQFSNYHVFHAESRIVTNIASQPAPPSSSPAVSETTSTNRLPPPNAEMDTTRESPPPGQEDVSRDEPAPSPERAVASLPPVAQPAEDIAPKAVAKPGDQVEPATAMSFKVRVNVVSVRAVVRDAQGHVVGDLRKEDFELFDNSKPQGISGFSVEKPLVVERPETQIDVHNSAGAQVASVPNVVESTPPHTPDRYIVYLFDDLHMTVGTLSMARKAAQRALADPSDPNTRVAITTTSGRVVLDFTDDRTKLAQTLSRIKPSSPSAHLACPPELSYYVADQILNEVDNNALRLAIMEEVDCGSKNPEIEARTAARISLNEHEGEVRAALSVLKVTARRLGLMPGQRSIILVSPGFLTTSMPTEIGDVIDQAMRTGVVISTMDARGLYVPPIAEEIEDNSAAPDPHNHEEIQLRAEYDTRDQAAVSGILGQLANGTGGTFFQNSNDMYAGFKQLGATPEVFYLLGFTPRDLKPDGTYHKLRVAIKDRKGLTIQARDGYYAPSTLADPAQQAKQEIENAVFSRDEIQDIPIVLHFQMPTPGAVAPKLVTTANVDLRSVAFQEHDGHNHNSILATFTLFDSDGKYIHGQQNKINLNYTQEQLASALASGLNLKSEFDAKPGHYFVRLVVRDEQGQMSASGKAVEIP